MTEYETNRGWSDRFIPEIKGILGTHLISIAPVAEDQERNTDLMVMTLDAIRVGCRIRRNRYLQHYGGEFTIRSNYTNGYRTELGKIIEGWGHYFFYGFSDTAENGLAKWALADLNVFRLYIAREMARNRGKVPGSIKDNRDGRNSFRCFRWSDLPGNFVVAQSSHK